MYQKCVCFLFLVILAIFSCSGFRIDSLAVTDLTDTKKNSLLMPSTFLPVDRLFRAEHRERRPPPHRIRHQRHSSRRDAPPLSPTYFPSQHLAQIPPTDVVPVRSQRSTKPRPKWQSHQPEDFFWKVYTADRVYLAELAFLPVNNSTGCSVYFKVKHDFKGNTPGFTRMVDCELLNTVYSHRNLKKEFALLEKFVAPNESIFTARLTSKINMRRFHRILKPGFEPKKPKITIIESVNKKQKRTIRCKVIGGFPIPRLTWRAKNGRDLSRKQDYNISYRRKTSKLTIHQSGAKFLGEYECIATSPNNETISKSIRLLPSRSSEIIISTDSKECEGNYSNFCMNGNCYVDEMNLPRCECPTGTTGERCDHKSPSDTSMYPQAPELYSCKLGLSTKYNCL